MPKVNKSNRGTRSQNKKNADNQSIEAASKAGSSPRNQKIMDMGDSK